MNVGLEGNGMRGLICGGIFGALFYGILNAVVDMQDEM